MTLYNYHVIYDKQNLYFFPNCIPFISLSYLTALSWPSITVLKSIGERGHSCFVSGLSQKAPSFSPLRMRLAIGFF